MPSSRTHVRSIRSLGAAFACLGLLLLTSSGCGAVRRSLPNHTEVAKAEATPIDGIWLNQDFGKRFRFEAGRMYILDPWVVGPVRIDPGQVTGVDIEQTGPRHYKGRDIGTPGPWSAEIGDARMSIVSPGPIGPIRSTAIPLELDDQAWFDAQLAATQIISRSGAARVAAASGVTGSFASYPRDDARPTDSTNRQTDLSLANPKAFGAYHALVIGNDAYRHLPRLETAVGDAATVADLLRDRYGFRVTLLQDATRGEILTSLRRMRESLTNTDNLLIYYAGHGWLDKDADEGYWLPVDAERDSDINWVSNATITGYLRSIRARHVMIVADSCYSGTLTRGIKLDVKPPDYLERIARLRARIVLSSGGLEPVADGGGGKHSAFARHFIDELAANEGVIDSTTLYARIRRPVMLAADQAPELADIRKAGHEGGDFLFIRTQDRGTGTR